MKFHDGLIDGVQLKSLARYHDGRGWLCELFRDDDVAPEFQPVMAYQSMTLPGVARGPHEHLEQADYFCFLGPSTFKLYLWDCRPGSPTRGTRQIELAGIDRPLMTIIPPGVVHAYRNIGGEPGLVFNAPNRLYKGWARQGPVDEIRHEDVQDSPFVLDEDEPQQPRRAA